MIVAAGVVDPEGDDDLGIEGLAAPRADEVGAGVEAEPVDPGVEGPVGAGRGRGPGRRRR